jgi:glycosyltransferase involved in cell wall biosynthesis
MQSAGFMYTSEDKAPVPEDHRPIRILHVVGGMNRGGTETWLMHVLRNIDRDRFQMDFLVHTTQPCAYDEEIRALGSKIIPCLSPSRPWLYARNFNKILREHGPYDVVHSHVHYFSGYVLWLVKQGGVPVRIAHSHLDSSPLEAEAGGLRRLYLAGMKTSINRNATLGLGCSQLANLDLFGHDRKVDLHSQILYCGIDLTSFQGPIDAFDIRTELGIPADAFVVGHVGRFQEQKNHRFLLEIFAEVVKRKPQSYLLLVGEGPLRSSVEQQASQMGLRDRIIFAGSRSDVARLMLGAMDVCLLPALGEGLGLVLIEAQAAGRPCVLSDVIPEEADVVHPLMQRLSLSQPANIWADAVLAARSKKSTTPQHDALATIAQSDFDIQTSAKKLSDLYTTLCSSHSFSASVR